MERFRLYNAAMTFLHLLQGILLIVLSNNFALPVTTNYISFNTVTQSLESASRNLFELRFGVAVAAFSLLSALFHLIIATVYYPTYKANLAKGINKARWWEYSLSASLMIVLIAMLSGVYDLSSLIMMFSLTAIMNICGLFMEIYNQGKEKVDWRTYLLGCFAGIIPWLVILIYFWGAASESNNAIPTFVYWIYVSIFIFFNSFAINMYLQYQKIGPWRDYKFGELMYIILSLVAKSALAWQIFAGTLRPN